MEAAKEVRARRDKWLAALLQEARDNIAAGKATNCVAAGLLTDTEEKLTKQDIRTILGGLMSGGFETVFSTAIAGIAYLAGPGGQGFQEKAYRDIVESCGGAEEAFSRCMLEEKSAYMVAFVRETLRFYPPLHLLPTRQTYQDFEWKGVKIPKGVMVLVNCQATSHDPETYGPDAHIFRPERWLKHKADHLEVPPPYHFAFGAGSRACTAINFSNRILYAIFLRLIVSFKIRQSGTDPPNLHFVDYNRNTMAQSAIPRDFKALFEPRDSEVLEECLRRSEQATVEVTNGILK
jgi:phenylacetate 2-hydroxylase